MGLLLTKSLGHVRVAGCALCTLRLVFGWGICYSARMFHKFFATMLVGGLVLGAETLANSLTVTNPGVWPLMKRARFNPAVKVTIQTDESKGIQKFDKLEVTLEDPDQVAKITLRTGDD